MSIGAIAVEKTADSKTGCVSATHAGHQSCSDDCIHKGKTCYADFGNQNWTSKRLSADQSLDPKTIADQEAMAIIDRLTGTRPLRIHVVGDCPDDECAQIVSKAADQYRMRHGQSVWSYTHSWRSVERKSWRSVSILASVELPKEIRQARDRGYASSIVIDSTEHPAKKYTIDGETIIACPNQWAKQNHQNPIQCIDCKLCWRDDRLLEKRLTIGFSLHGCSRADRQVYAAYWAANR